jgi:hypothetical protein
VRACGSEPPTTTTIERVSIMAIKMTVLVTDIYDDCVGNPEKVTFNNLEDATDFADREKRAGRIICIKKGNKIVHIV